MLDEGWPTTVKKSVSGIHSFITPSHLLSFPLHQTCCLLHVHLSRSSSLRTAVRTMCVRQTWCCRLIWTSLGQGTDMRCSSILLCLHVTLTRSDTHLLGLSDFSLCFPHRQKPYVIRSPRRRLAVEVQLQNRLENAYNTSLTLHYSRNLHFSSLSIRVKHTHILLMHEAPRVTNQTHLHR